MRHSEGRDPGRSAQPDPDATETHLDLPSKGNQ
jgi:hypothetical protein